MDKYKRTMNAMVSPENGPLQYILNTGKGNLFAHFLEDYSPVGEALFKKLEAEGLVEATGDRIYVTEKGKQHLQDGNSTSEKRHSHSEN